MRMEFEYDETKSASNYLKHGIDFKMAQDIWLDGARTQILARMEDEERWYVIGMLLGKLWTAVVTKRGDKVRLISVRRARKGERDLYEIRRVRP
jgi:uncharacterized DUF497 family protein